VDVVVGGFADVSRALADGAWPEPPPASATATRIPAIARTAMTAITRFAFTSITFDPDESDAAPSGTVAVVRRCP